MQRIWILHRPLYRRKGIKSDSSLGSSTNNHLIFMIESVLRFCQQIPHSIAGCHVWQEPQRMCQHTVKS